VKSGVARGAVERRPGRLLGWRWQEHYGFGLPCVVKLGGRKVARYEARARGGRVSVNMSKG
jgi:hypothetical protein